MARVAELVGTPLFDWQRYVLDVALEVDLERGTFAYDEVLLSVARQQGKTTLLVPWEVARLVVPPLTWADHGLALPYPQIALYTAQTGKAAERKFRDDQLPALAAAAAVLKMGRPRMSQGSMLAPFRYGRLYVSAPNDDAGRGGQLDAAFVDEARQLDGSAEDGIDPAMATRHAAQKILTSNVGRRPWWRGKLAAGRNAVIADPGQGLALFEWGAGRDDDPADPATWELALPSFHARTPAGFALVRPDFLAAQYRAAVAAGKLDTFREEFLNVEVLEAPERGVDLERWAELADPDATAPPGDWWIAADAAPDRSWAAIALAVAVGDRIHAELVAEGPGVAWAAAAVRKLARARGRVRIDTYGPAGNLLAELAPALGARLEPAGTADVARACGALLDAVSSGRLRHRGQPELAAALEGARARAYGDTALWDRRRTSPAVLALSLAVDGAVRPAAPAPWALGRR